MIEGRIDPQRAYEMKEGSGNFGIIGPATREESIGAWGVQTAVAFPESA
jgi:hypothetical protein